MAGEVLSPNMNLPVPGVSLTDGPQWATDLNNCLSLIDSHTHTSGSGVPITPDAISMTSDLPFSNQSATGLASTVYSAQASLSTLKAVYVIAKDLYYNDADGNVVRITQSGGVAGSPGSISNLTSPASAAYSAAQTKFIWQSDSNIAADMDFGAIITRNITPNSTFAITISPPASLASNYGLQWPALPASQKFMALDASGNMAAPWAVDGSTLEISGGTTLQAKDLGITTAKIANNAVTPGKIIAMNTLLTSSCGNGATNSTSTFATVINLTGSFTSVGGSSVPIFITLISDGVSGNASRLTSSGGQLSWRILRDATVVAQGLLGNGVNDVVDSVSSISAVDIGVAAGTYTYSVQIAKVSGSSVSANFAKLFVREMLGGS